MKTLVKTKWFWQYTKVVILNPADDQVKFGVYGKKDKVVGIIMTYIGVDCPH